MIMQAIVFLALLAAQTSPVAGPLPKDVNNFVWHAETCEHMAGEWDGDLPKSRRKEITSAIQKHCAPAKRQLPRLMQKYKDQPEILTVISRHAYDSVKSYTDTDGPVGEGRRQ